jgi:hypothetical protein
LPKRPDLLKREKILRKALDETLQMLGERGMKLVVSYLVSRKAYAEDSGDYLDIGTVSEGLTVLFGLSVSEMLMEAVILRMDELYSISLA